MTGASLGIGRATAVQLATEGAQIVVNYFGDADAKRGREQAVEETARLIRDAGGDPLVLEADVSNQTAVRAMVDAAQKHFGRIDIVVNNAAIEQGGTLLETEEREWDRVLAVNLKAQFLVAQAVVAPMMARHSGKIVNVSSELALIGRAAASAYVASKAGVIGLTKSLARELAPYGILVNCVAPGPVNTDLLSPLERTPELLKAIPLGRIGEPADIASAICFLVSPGAGWITGQVLSPNGGIVI